MSAQFRDKKFDNLVLTLWVILYRYKITQSVKKLSHREKDHSCTFWYIENVLATVLVNVLVNVT